MENTTYLLVSEKMEYSVLGDIAETADATSAWSCAYRPWVVSVSSHTSANIDRLQ